MYRRVQYMMYCAVLYGFTFTYMYMYDVHVCHMYCTKLHITTYYILHVQLKIEEQLHVRTFKFTPLYTCKSCNVRAHVRIYRTVHSDP